MSEETQAAPSPAEVEDVFQGEQVSLSEFNKYRADGTLPERFKPAEPADPAPADPPKEASEGDELETEPDSDPEEIQEPPQKGAEKRIKQLLAKTKELERKLAEKQDVKAESSPEPAPQLTNSYQDWEKAFNADKWIEEYAKANPEASFERANAAMFSHMLSTREQFKEREQVQQEAQKALQGKLDEARSRYDDADDVIFPASEAIQSAKIPQVVKEVFGQSDLFIDLCYVVGSDPEELKKFISLAQTNPRAAIGKVFEYERGIREELSTPRDDKGKFMAPEVKKTSAPKPPSPVGGASSRAFDVSDESLSNEEWMRKRNHQLSQKKG